MNDHHEKTHIKTNSNTDSTGFSFNSFNMIDKSAIEDLIKCDICNIIFDSVSHAPLMIKCGHTFCKRCISFKNNNPKKNLNKMCPLCKKKNVMIFESAIPNLKLESIVKKITNLNVFNNKRHIVYSKPAKKNIFPNKLNNTNNILSSYFINNNPHNNENVNINNNIKNNDNNINNVNIINKGKEPNNQQNSIKTKVNINSHVNKKSQSNKLNNINLVNTIKNKISSLSNVNNLNVNTVNNDINKLNPLNKIPSNGQMKTISSEINELNLNTPKLEDELNSEEEKFKNGMNNETIDTIPFCDEKVGDTSFGGDINELLLKSIAQKKIFINEETMNEDFNISLKELNLMGNQNSLNISLTNSKEENNNNLNIFKINKANLLDKQNHHQIRTIYDKIKSKLKNAEEQKEKNNNNIINNISNSIIIINDDNINIITDNSSSQSQEIILRNNAILGEKLSKNNDDNIKNNLEIKNNDSEILKLNQLNINKNNFFRNEPNIINILLKFDLSYDNFFQLNKNIKENEISEYKLHISQSIIRVAFSKEKAYYTDEKNYEYNFIKRVIEKDAEETFKKYENNFRILLRKEDLCDDVIKYMFFIFGNSMLIQSFIKPVKKLLKNAGIDENCKNISEIEDNKMITVEEFNSFFDEMINGLFESTPHVIRILLKIFYNSIIKYFSVKENDYNALYTALFFNFIINPRIQMPYSIHPHKSNYVKFLNKLVWKCIYNNKFIEDDEDLVVFNESIEMNNKKVKNFIEQQIISIDENSDEVKNSLNDLFTEKYLIYPKFLFYVDSNLLCGTIQGGEEEIIDFHEIKINNK